MAPYTTPARPLSQVSKQHSRHTISWAPHDLLIRPTPQVLANSEVTSTARSIAFQPHTQANSELHAYPVILQEQTATVGYQAVATPTSASNIGSITVPVSIALDSTMSGSGFNRHTSTAISSMTSYQAITTTTIVSSLRTSFLQSTTSATTLSSPHASSSVFVHNHSISASSSPAAGTSLPIDHQRSFTLRSPEGMATLAGAAVLILAAIAVIYRLCHPRRRAARKSISKPIPHAVFEADSPIFGAGERQTPTSDIDKTAWTWTTYSLPYQETSPPSSAETSWDEKASYPVHAPALTTAIPGLHLPMGSLTTNPPLDSSNNSSSISTSLLAQLPPYLEQCPPSIASPATIYPLASADCLNDRRNTRLSYMSIQSSAYGGCTTSPSLPASDLPVAIPTRPVPGSSSSTSNRAKIKTPYPIGHARQSSTSTVKMYMPNRLTYTLLPLPSLYIPDTASGLDGMWPLSTEIPSARSEDPSRLVGNLSTEQNREQLRKIAVQSVEDTSAALEQRRWQRQQQARSLTNMTEAVGALMLADRDAPPTPVLDGRFVQAKTANYSTPMKAQKRPMRSGDRPPRVPSPPPLPSLEQMALAEHDPNYRSPTYSLYACYDAETR